jgi:hypothetical protein
MAQMEADDVIALLNILEQERIRVVVDGGWERSSQQATLYRNSFSMNLFNDGRQTSIE